MGECELEQSREIFDRFDMDSDGSITILELRALGLMPSGDQVHTLLTNMDSNGNGSVELDELVNALQCDFNDELLMNQWHLLELFHLFDRDGNRYITAVELASCMAKMGQPLTYNKELTEMIEEADIDEDGVINFNEFASVMATSGSNILGLS